MRLPRMRPFRIDLARQACLFFATLMLAFPAFADPALTPHQARYKVKVSIVSGELKTELRRDSDGRYTAVHEIRPTGMSRILARGSIRETSEFVETTDGIRPLEYRSVDTLSNDPEDVDIQFDWQSAEARGTVNDAVVMSVMDGVAHDRISIQYELMHDLVNGKPHSEYILFDVDQLKTLTVTNIGTRNIKVPAGQFEAVGIHHQTANSRRSTTLWCVKELDYLPVVIEQYRKGELRVRAVLTEYSPTGA